MLSMLAKDPPKFDAEKKTPAKEAENKKEPTGPPANPTNKGR